MTTIAVGRDTLNQLKHLKERENIATFDQLIKKMITQFQKPENSLFGKFKKLKTFEREEIDRFD